MPNTSNITNMPDLKKLFVYVNFTDVEAQGGLTALKGQLKISSQTKYPERVFYVANDGSIITHGQEFGVSDELKQQIATLQTESTNLQTTVKALTGLDNVPAAAGEVTISDTSVIGKYVQAQIFKNKTIVAAKKNSGITVEETADSAGTTTYTIGTDLKQIVDAKSIITKDGKLSSNVELTLVHEAGKHGEQSPFLVLQTRAVTGNADENENHPFEIISKFDVSEFINDGMIQSVVYNEENGDLVFTWNADSTADDSAKTTTVNLAKLFNIEGIHSDNEKYITVGIETPGDHDDKGKVKAYHIAAVVDKTDLKEFSKVTYTPASDDADAKYATNYGNDAELSMALGTVSGLVDANKVAAKIAQIDKDIVKVGNDAIAREKTLTDGIDAKIADLQRQLTEEASARADMDTKLYGEAIPEDGPKNTIKKNADAIAILNGNDGVVGSVDAKIKALKESLDAEVEYKDVNSLVKVAVSQVDGVVSAKENAVTVKTAKLTVNADSDAEYTLGSASPSGFTQAGGYKAKGLNEVAADDPSLVTNQDAWIYGQCIKSQAVASIASDNNQYIKIVREDNQTKVAFEPWTEVHTIEELAQMDGADYVAGN